MGPKKKGKGNKLARMSEEERIRYMQHRAAIEEEARMRKEQLIATYMKNKLKHEEAFTRLNSAKLNQQWRQILRQYKCSELKEDMNCLWQTFEAAIVTKNRVIEALLNDLDEAEEQYSMALTHHMETIDSLIGLHIVRLEDLGKQYRCEKNDLLEKRRIEWEIITKNSDCSKEYLQTVMFDMEQRALQDTDGARGKAAAREDDLRNHMLSEIEKVEEACGVELERLWSEFQRTLMEYAASTIPQKAHYNTLKARDENSSISLIRHCEMVNKYADTIAFLKQHLSSLERRHREDVKRLTSEQEVFLACLQKLRNEAYRNNTKDQRQLTNLTFTSDSVIKELTSLVEKGEQILHVGLNCQKLMSDHNGIPLVNHDSSGEDRSDNHKKFDEEPFKELENMWAGYNQVLLERDALKLDYELYTGENRQLRKMLRHYLSTLAMPRSIA